jgi:hypothetical protein
VAARSWFVQHKVVSGVGALLAVGLLASACDDEAGAKRSAAGSSVTTPTPTSEQTIEATTEPATAATQPPGAAQLIASAKPKTALALLGTLAVKGRAPMTGYSRAEFGAAWADTNRNGCDTRNDVLRRDLVRKAVKPGTNGCVVLSGDRAPDPYTGATIHFVRGGASEIDIDHVVALGNSWITGASRWSDRKRLALANDPLNLLAVDASANRQKGDGDAATWLPGNKGFRCAYVARQVAVKAKYQLWVTSAERDAIARVLGTCTSLVAPAGGNPTLAPFSSSSGSTTSSPKPVATTVPVSAAKTYANCTELHQDYPHGVGRPGAVDHTSGPPVTTFTVDAALYDANQGSDRDKDGIACEKR